MGRISTRVMAVFLGVMLTSSAAGADERKQEHLVISRHVIQQAITNSQLNVPVAPGRFGKPQQRTGSVHTGRRIAWTAIGAVGGFFGGAYLGAAIENAVAPCGCDDPGLKGALIGMPIGAVAGGVAGFLLSR
jgi:hypothetical protein